MSPQPVGSWVLEGFSVLLTKSANEICGFGKTTPQWELQTRGRAWRCCTGIHSSVRARYRQHRSDADLPPQPGALVTTLSRHVVRGYVRRPPGPLCRRLADARASTFIVRVCTL